MKCHILFFIILAVCPLSAGAASFTPEGDIIGGITVYKTREEDNLYALARKFDVGIVEMLAANSQVDPWLPGQGTILTIPTMHVLPLAPRKGIVLNLSELRLFYFPGDGSVLTFPVGIGRDGWQTPVGTTKIAHKREGPSWIPPASIREEKPDLPEIMLPGPDNPMGAYALYLGWKRYAIHGTNRPAGIGTRSSHGCIRLYPEDIETLFHAVAINTPVTIIDTPFKLGWRGNELILEVTPTQAQTDEITAYRKPLPVNRLGIRRAIRDMVENATQIDWYKVEQTILWHDGIPVVIGKKR